MGGWGRAVGVVVMCVRVRVYVCVCVCVWVVRRPLKYCNAGAIHVEIRKRRDGLVTSPLQYVPLSHIGPAAQGAAELG